MQPRWHVHQTWETLSTRGLNHKVCSASGDRTGQGMYYPQHKHRWCARPTLKRNPASHKTNGRGSRKAAAQWKDFRGRQGTSRLDSCNGERCHLLTCEHLDGLFCNNSPWMPGLIGIGW